jgi:2-polyprenyl-6-hydroxyphenyl methylase / 3-demethylubiquinone-9 3-methyltransferase
MSQTVTPRHNNTVDDAEVAHFDRLAADWWNPRGSMRPLHKYNPVRVAYIRDAACRRFGRDSQRDDCLAGLRILDIGCGGGLLCEPLARLGATMLGADPAVSNISVAKRHAAASGLSIDYRPVTAEAMADDGERFDLVLAMEVVEHVTDVGVFVEQCAAMVKPGGLMIAATINRTLKSFLVAIVGAEYVTRMLPRGTHHWRKLVTPHELEGAMRRAGLPVIDCQGIIYSVVKHRFRRVSSLAVNYIMVAERPN